MTTTTLWKDQIQLPAPTTAVSGKTPVLIAVDPYKGPGRYRWLAGSVPTSDRVRALVFQGDPEQLPPWLPNRWSSLPRLDQIRLAGQLAGGGISAAAIAALLENKDRSEVWRWASLSKASTSLRDAVLEGVLLPGHAKSLLKLPVIEQSEWVQRARRGRWSVRRLATEVMNPGSTSAPESSGDTQKWQKDLSARLNAKVELQWPTDPKGPRSLSVEWFDVESLKGVLEQLSAGPELAVGVRHPLRRVLTISLVDTDELEALTGHLVTES